MCSSPQLIAAYHVLLRLLEPRHPPYALICFKKIQIFKSLTSLKVTRYYNFIPNMSKSYHHQPSLPFHVHSLRCRFSQTIADVSDSNHSIPKLHRFGSHLIYLKNFLKHDHLPSLLSDHFVILRRAIVFKRATPVWVWRISESNR